MKVKHFYLCLMEITSLPLSLTGFCDLSIYSLNEVAYVEDGDYKN